MSRDLVVALSGGIGGAKLALGLSRILPADDLIVVANVGDDFEHLGLHISPDADTLMYTLAGLDNSKLGWGRQDETWAFMETLTALGGEDWFRLGDCDLAVHVERTRRLRQGETLSAITADFCRRLGVGPRVLPATDDRLRTRLRADEGWLDFQDYFVRLQCRPVVRELAFDGAEHARPHPDLLAALRDERLRDRIHLQPVVRPPRGGGGVGVQGESLQDAPEAHPFGIEEPSAVARLQDERFHAWIIAQKRDDQPSTVLRLCDDR